MNHTSRAPTGHDTQLLLARVLMMLLFLIFGIEKVTGFADTSALFAHMGVPAPTLATLAAIAAELGMGVLLVLGLATRPLALLMAVYTLATAFIGHHYWTLSGHARFFAEIDFYKNVSIVGGLLLLHVTGAGRYSIDQRIGLR